MHRAACGKFLSVVTLLVFIAACSDSGCSSPEERAQKTVEQFIKAEILGDEEAMKDTVVAADRAVLEDQEGEEFGPGEEMIFEVLESRIDPLFEMEVTSVELDGEVMTMSVDSTEPRSQAFEEAIFQAVLGTDLEGVDEDDEEEIGRRIADAVDKNLDESEIPTEDRSREFTLLLEDNQWLVNVELEARQRIIDATHQVRELTGSGDYDEAHERLAALRGESSDELDEELQRLIDEVHVNLLYRESGGWRYDPHKYERALAHYREIVDIDPDWEAAPISEEEARETIAELEEKVEEQTVLDTYREKVAISDELSVVSGALMDRVEGELTNGGDRILETVWIEYSLLDEKGSEVDSDESLVVRGSFDEDRVLAAGETTQFEILVSESPDSWAEDVELKVGEITFVK